MTRTVWVALVAFLLVYVSMTFRVNKIQSMRTRKQSFQEAQSPLGEAIKDFVAVSGGVYLGLMALTEFLKVPVPVIAEIWGITFDPMALIASQQR